MLSGEADRTQEARTSSMSTMKSLLSRFAAHIWYCTYAEDLSSENYLESRFTLTVPCAFAVSGVPSLFFDISGSSWIAVECLVAVFDRPNCFREMSP